MILATALRALGAALIMLMLSACITTADCSYVDGRLYCEGEGNLPK